MRSSTDWDRTSTRVEHRDEERRLEVVVRVEASRRHLRVHVERVQSRPADAEGIDDGRRFCVHLGRLRAIVPEGSRARREGARCRRVLDEEPHQVRRARGVTQRKSDVGPDDDRPGPGCVDRDCRPDEVVATRCEGLDGHRGRRVRRGERSGPSWPRVARWALRSLWAGRAARSGRSRGSSGSGDGVPNCDRDDGEDDRRHADSLPNPDFRRWGRRGFRRTASI